MVWAFLGCVLRRCTNAVCYVHISPELLQNPSDPVISAMEEPLGTVEKETEEDVEGDEEEDDSIAVEEEMTASKYLPPPTGFKSMQKCLSEYTEDSLDFCESYPISQDESSSVDHGDEAADIEKMSPLPEESPPAECDTKEDDQHPKTFESLFQNGNELESQVAQIQSNDVLPPLPRDSIDDDDMDSKCVSDIDTGGGSQAHKHHQHHPPHHGAVYWVLQELVARVVALNDAPQQQPSPRYSNQLMFSLATDSLRKTLNRHGVVPFDFDEKVKENETNQLECSPDGQIQHDEYGIKKPCKKQTQQPQTTAFSTTTTTTSIQRFPSPHRRLRLRSDGRQPNRVPLKSVHNRYHRSSRSCAANHHQHRHQSRLPSTSPALVADNNDGEMGCSYEILSAPIEIPKFDSYKTLAQEGWKVYNQVPSDFKFRGSSTSPPSSATTDAMAAAQASFSSKKTTAKDSSKTPKQRGFTFWNRAKSISSSRGSDIDDDEDSDNDINNDDKSIQANDQKTHAFPLDQLPLTVLIQVFDLLNYSDRLKASLVCKTFQTAVKSAWYSTRKLDLRKQLLSLFPDELPNGHAFCALSDFICGFTKKAFQKMNTATIRQINLSHPEGSEFHKWGGTIMLNETDFRRCFVGFNWSRVRVLNLRHCWFSSKMIACIAEIFPNLHSLRYSSERFRMCRNHQGTPVSSYYTRPAEAQPDMANRDNGLRSNENEFYQEMGSLLSKRLRNWDSLRLKLELPMHEILYMFCRHFQYLENLQMCIDGVKRFKFRRRGERRLSPNPPPPQVQQADDEISSHDDHTSSSTSSSDDDDDDDDDDESVPKEKEEEEENSPKLNPTESSAAAKESEKGIHDDEEGNDHQLQPESSNEGVSANNSSNEADDRTGTEPYPNGMRLGQYWWYEGNNDGKENNKSIACGGPAEGKGGKNCDKNDSELPSEHLQTQLNSGETQSDSPLNNKSSCDGHPKKIAFESPNTINIPPPLAHEQPSSVRKLEDFDNSDLQSMNLPSSMEPTPMPEICQNDDETENAENSAVSADRNLSGKSSEDEENGNAIGQNDSDRSDHRNPVIYDGLTPKPV